MRKNYVVTTTIQAMLDAIPEDEEATLFIPEGVYDERIESRHKDLVVEGEGMATVIVGCAGAFEMMPDGMKRGTFRTATAYFEGERLALRNLVIRNDAGDGRKVGQAIALYLDVRNATLSHMGLYGHQDTLFLAPLPDKEREKNGFVGPGLNKPRLESVVAIGDSEISGDADFIFGGADATFSHCRLISLVRPGCVSAPSGKKDGLGFVFDHCDFLGDGCPEGSTFLMRPWRPEGKSTFISCRYGKHINKRKGCPCNGREAEGFHIEEEGCSWIDGSVDRKDF